MFSWHELTDDQIKCLWIQNSKKKIANNDLKCSRMPVATFGLWFHYSLLLPPHHLPSEENTGSLAELFFSSSLEALISCRKIKNYSSCKSPERVEAGWVKVGYSVDQPCCALGSPGKLLIKSLFQESCFQ